VVALLEAATVAAVRDRLDAGQTSVGSGSRSTTFGRRGSVHPCKPEQLSRAEKIDA
jgi:hypothetical protein